MDRDASADLERRLQAILQGDRLTPEAIARLTAIPSAFPQTPLDVQQRVGVLRKVYPQVQDLCGKTLGWRQVPLLTLWRLWLPLAEHLINLRATRHHPVIQGFLGGQGTGKTTLAQVLTRLLASQGYRVASLSLDDLYKTYAERQQLQQSAPRLRWRGPPGTHDVNLGLAVLHSFRRGKGLEISLPRFDKSLHGGMGDRTTAESMAQVDILLFEGWFVGIRPIEATAFDPPTPPPLVTAGDRAFARDCNTRLYDYLPLWDTLDSLIALNPVDYHLCKQWRKQAEQAMVQQGRSGMSDGEIEEFVEYFWKALHPELFWPPLLADAQRIDWIIDIQADHTPGAVYQPI